MKRFAFAYVFLSILVSCQTHYTLDPNPKVNYVDVSGVKPDSALTAVINPYKTKLDTEMDQVVGYLAEDLEKGNPEGKLGDFIADIIYKKAIAEYMQAEETHWDSSYTFCILNNGGLRAGLQKGAVTKREVYEVLPFENYMVVYQMSARRFLKDIPKYIFEKKGQPLSENVDIEFKAGKCIKFELSGIPVDSSHGYRIVTNDYMANKGDNCYFFGEDLNRHDFTVYKLRDVVIEYFQQNSSQKDSLRSKNFGRIKIE